MTRPTALNTLSETQLRLIIAAAIALINIIGAVSVVLVLLFVVPLPSIHRSHDLQIDNLKYGVIYATLGLTIGVFAGSKIGNRATEWMRDDREPSDAEKQALIAIPRRFFLLQLWMWVAGALFFGYFNSTRSDGLGVLVALVMLMAGFETSSMTYLVAERLIRPFARRALAGGVPEQIGMRLGVRTFVSWLLGSGLNLLGIALAGVTALALGPEIGAQRLGITMLVLGLLSFVTGAFTTFLASRASSDPVKSLRLGVAQVRGGDFNAEVQIYDGTELGILQAGFNDMVAGLRERENITDLFGRHVGADVARAALLGGVKLGGELRRVGVLFVDIVGSTAFATNRPPEEVVSMLNKFFDIVVQTVDRNGGWINKFEGDAALAVWGAPTEQWGVATDLLRAARELGERLHDEMPEIRAGIGVSIGKAVAGNVGASKRYEYTVIGDAVNEAARLSDLAKTYDGTVLARGDMVGEAAGQGKPGEAEAALWRELAPVTLRGREALTRIAVPVPRAAR